MSTTALLLNWKRQDRIPLTIQSIRKQDAGVKIWLWNNNPADTKSYDVDYQFNSPENFKCWPRWLLGSMVTTDYIFTLDDDLTITNPRHISNCISYIKSKPIDTILGFTGVILERDKTYWQSPHINATPNRDARVDIVKGRFMFMRSSLLNSVKLENDPTCEDIKVSSYSKNKFIPGIFHNCFQNLPEGDESLWKQPIQHNNRIVAAMRYFPENYTKK
jgi:hypothetical protein